MNPVKSIIKRKAVKYINSSYLAENKFTCKDAFDLRMIDRFYSRYHPSDLHEGPSINSKRNVQDRYDVISRHLQGSNCVDIGCQAGYFSFQIARQGYWVTGLDRDRIILKKAQLIKKKHRIENVDFRHFEINEEEIDKIPRFDNAIYLSIHHHMIKVYGFERASLVLNKLSKKASRLFFDFPYPRDFMGIPEFVNIPDMGEDPNLWIENYLKKSGFAHVTLLGVFEHSEKKGEKRPLFMAEV